MDVLLVNPSAQDYLLGENTVQFMRIAPPLGLGYIAAVLNQRGYTVDIACVPGERLKRADLEKRLRQTQPKILGIYSIVSSHNTGIRIAEMARKIVPGIIIVMGGPHVSFLAEETLRSGLVDVVCRFEGEYTMLELTDHYLKGIGTLADIRGIAYLQEEELQMTPMRPFIENLDELPFPARNLLKMHDGYQRPGSIISGRGCPFGCLFCAANVLSGSRYRMRSTDNVLAEIEEMIERYGLTEIHFYDDTFTANRQRVRKICEGMIERKLTVRWFCDSRVNTIDEELLDLMYEAGCRSVQFGIESGNDRILGEINKGITTSQVEHAVEMALKRGIGVYGGIILGHPQDTKETVEDSIRFGEKLGGMARQLGGDIVIAFPVLTPLPGSYIYENADKLGVKFVSRNWDHYTFELPVIETKHLKKEDLQNLVMEAYARCPNKLEARHFS